MANISLITPTKDRHTFLPKIWKCVLGQTVQDFEWLVHDSSATKSKFMEDLQAKDDRVRYEHVPDDKLTTGTKRNSLIDTAKGNYIVHIDDDDHYAPRYVEDMLAFMANEKADLVKLFGFYLFHRQSRHYGYWDLTIQFSLHFMMSGSKDIHVGVKQRNAQDEWGYGFSYVYKREVWENNPFPDLNLEEDQPWVTTAPKTFKGRGKHDNDFLALHVVHGNNSSASHPQQLFPPGLLDQFFPEFSP